MPLIIEGRVPNRWLDKKKPHSTPSVEDLRRPGALNLALINNMPDAALEDTELQFFELLDIASCDTPIVLKLYSLTGIPRTERGARHLNSFYFDFEDLWKSPIDGVIITGTEPHQPNLRDEPYWALLGQVFDWAEGNTNSTILSCLAAHASVLHCDGIGRHRLPDKRFGVFQSTQVCDHPLMGRAGRTMQFPHSRWNEVRENDLTAAGYTVLTKSPEAGVDLFLKKKPRSLFVHFQGHPEYGAGTLLKEYRRDIKRFLRGERETYPTMPAGYFDGEAVHLLSQFQKTAVMDRREKVIDAFPESIGESVRSTWQAAAKAIYREWLDYLSRKKESLSATSSFARVQRPRSTSIGGEIA